MLTYVLFNEGEFYGLATSEARLAQLLGQAIGGHWPKRIKFADAVNRTKDTPWTVCLYYDSNGAPGERPRGWL